MDQQVFRPEVGAPRPLSETMFDDAVVVGSGPNLNWLIGLGVRGVALSAVYTAQPAANSRKAAP